VAACDLQPAKKGRKLPRVLTADEFRKFYAVDKADDVQHALMLRLLFYRRPGERVVRDRGGGCGSGAV
jgi:integrase